MMQINFVLHNIRCVNQPPLDESNGAGQFEIGSAV